MAAPTGAQSAHLRELLRFAEAQHGIPIRFDATEGCTNTGLVLWPPDGSEQGSPILLHCPNGVDLVIGHQEGGAVRMALDLDGIILGSRPIPEGAEDMGAPAFVSRAVDTLVEQAVKAQRSSLIEQSRRVYVFAKCRASEERLSGLKMSQMELGDRIHRLRNDLEYLWRRKVDVDRQVAAEEGLTRPETRHGRDQGRLPSM